jgi:hypothetical protein
MSPADEVRRMELQAMGLSIIAGLIHAILSPTHLEEWWGYGLFFFFAAALQIMYGIALGGGVFRPENWKGDWLAATRNFLALGIVGNLAIIAMYLVSRTIGIPFFGPEAGTVEPFGVIDVVSKAIEVVLVVWLVRLFRRFPRASPVATTAASP